jgi:acyl-CoA synthetase (AMP-forming)/AMP-acid ligase II
VSRESNPLSARTIGLLARQRASRELWVDDAATRTWTDFDGKLEAARRTCSQRGVEPGAVVLIRAEESLDFLAWVFAAASLGAVVAPHRTASEGGYPTWSQGCRIDWRVDGDGLARVNEGTMSPVSLRLIGELRARGNPGLILATGGTTGTPKVLLHDLDSLLAVAPVKAGRPWRTLPLMRFDHIGGLDMAWRALAGGHVLVAPPKEITMAAVGATIERHRVEVLPATPSFLNLMLMADIHRTRDLSSLRIVPYGAELMPAGLLRRLRAALPWVEFVQRFGTSETGALPVRAVAGSEGMSLSKDRSDFSWKIVDGELWLCSPSRALGYLVGDSGGLDQAGWFRTGDLAEQLPDGGIRILGRRQDLINVGGEKVLPCEVEAVLLELPEIADCLVCAEPNAITGQVVCAQVVLAPGTDPTTIRGLVRGFCRDRLAAHKVPMKVIVMDRTRFSDRFKKLRRGGRSDP